MGAIGSTANPAFKALLKAGRDRGLMLLEGRRLVGDALSRGMTPALTAITPGYAQEHGLPGVPHAILGAKLFGRIAATATPQGILAFFPVPWASFEEAASRDRIVVLDGLQDPGNAGAIVRTAEAFGATGVIFLKGAVSPYNPKTLRASAGSVFRVPLVAGLDAALARAAIEQKRLDVYATQPNGNKRLADVDFTRRSAIIIGSEGHGVSDTLRSAAIDLRIPTSGVESLNAAVAAAVILYEASRQRTIRS